MLGVGSDAVTTPAGTGVYEDALSTAVAWQQHLERLVARDGGGDGGCPGQPPQQPRPFSFGGGKWRHWDGWVGRGPASLKDGLEARLCQPWHQGTRWQQPAAANFTCRHGACMMPPRSYYPWHELYTSLCDDSGKAGSTISVPSSWLDSSV